MSAEYGWADEVIWELPLARFRQITAAIQQRRFFQKRDEDGRFSWLARNLAGFIVNGYMADAKDKKEPLAQAGSLAYDDIEAAMLGATPDRQTSPSVPTENGKAPDIDPNEAIARALAKNSNGSFERLRGMVGGLDQRGKML